MEWAGCISVLWVCSPRVVDERLKEAYPYQKRYTRSTPKWPKQADFKAIRSSIKKIGVIPKQPEESVFKLRERGLISMMATALVN